MKKKYYLVVFRDAKASELHEYNDETDVDYGEAMFAHRPYIVIKAPSPALCLQELRRRKIPVLEQFVGRVNNMTKGLEAI